MQAINKLQDIHIPFDATGNMMCYTDVEYPSLPSYDYTTRSYVGSWKRNEPFHDILQYDDCRKGRSAITFWWRSVTTGARYTMFLSELDYILRNVEFVCPGLVDHRWYFVKRGANYSLAASKH